MVDGIKHIKSYDVVYPKDMDKMEYSELVEIFNEAMELLANAVRYEIFRNYDGDWPDVDINSELE